jgi:hypothetical protein
LEQLLDVVQAFVAIERADDNRAQACKPALEFLGQE